MAVARTALALAAAVASTAATVDRPGHSTPHDALPATMNADDRIAAQLATAADQDVERAEADGYASTLDTLGCFEDAAGGMGVHYLNEARLDDSLDLAAPEALVYELHADGSIAGLVAHEYIVPVDKWTSTDPPELAGVPLHVHPTLPLWVLHAWVWKDNPAGDYADWNPAVRPCPDGVPIFGVDLPAPATSSDPPERQRLGGS